MRPLIRIDKNILLIIRLLILLFLVLIFCNRSVYSQNDTIELGHSVGIQLSGAIRLDYISDSRQTAEATEGLFTFYPLKKEFDVKGKDINSVPSSNFVSLTTRIGTMFFAPDLFGAKTSAFIEFDFTGISNTNGLRLRQAYINFTREKLKLLIGRTWHPLSSGNIPSLVAPNKGAPFYAFNRSDMIKLDYITGQWLISGATIYQGDFASLGPVPGSKSSSVKSTSFLRNAYWPELAFHISYKTKLLQTGTIASMKSLKPRLYTMSDYTNPYGQKYFTNEKLTTYVTQTYISYQKLNWLLKMQIIYSQNATELLMLGGYAVRTRDAFTGYETYTPTQHMSYWLNVIYGKKLQFGLFTGYINNLGTLDNIEGTWYARSQDIKYLYRISPHLLYNLNNMQFAVEIEYTTAAYGEVQNDQKSKILNISKVSNLRSNFSVTFNF